MMLTVLSYLWHDPDAERPYTSDDVRLLKRMVDRYLTVPHEHVCATDRPGEFSASDGIRVVRQDAGVGYARKLLTFHPDARDLFGERLLVLDLDCVVTGLLDPLVSRPEPLVLWRNPARVPWENPVGKGAYRARYNTSMILHTSGTERDLWRPTLTGGDQDWVSGVIGPDCPYWDSTDGVRRLLRDDAPGSGIGDTLPDGTRIVFFVGSEHKPWRPDVQARFPWIAEYRR